MTYCVTLANCTGLSESSLRQAEGAFCMALEHALSAGPAEVGIAHQAYSEVLAKHGGALPLEAPAVDRELVERWEDAYGAACEAAFVGWARRPDAARFDVASAP